MTKGAGGDSARTRVLAMLKEAAGGFCPGPEMAERLGLSRTAVWKHVRALKARGYAIESRSREGYRLSGAPDLLMPEEVLPALQTSWLGREYHYYPRTGSTNDEALRLARRGARHGCVALAEEQTKGRGRLGRSWLSAPGRGLTLSIVLTTALPVRDASQCLLVLALALVKVLLSRYGLPAAVKWPNDVLIGGKKVAGILSEMESEEETVRFIVIGIGINVNQRGEALRGPFRYPATSVAEESGKSVSRVELLASLLGEFEREYDRFLREGFAVFLPEMEAASGILGRNIKVLRGEEEISGLATGFTPEGGLEVLRDDGKREVLWVGDITTVSHDPETGKKPG